MAHTRWPSKATSCSPLLPLITESQSEQVLLSDAEPFEAKVAEKVLPTPLNSRSSWPTTFDETLG